MKWLEFIRVRCSVSLEKTLNDDLRDQIKKLSGTHGLLEAVVYDHADVPGDICVILSWGTDLPVSGGSTPGIGLTRVFKKSGMVAHSVWIEHQDQKDSSKEAQ